MRRAIVICNSEYQHDELITISSCENDGFGVKEALLNLGFDVVFLLNSDIKTMKKQIKLFVNSLEEGDVSLFYYSGHGVNVGGRGLVTARDTDIKNLKNTTLCLNKYINLVSLKPTKCDILILDCCRNQLKRHYKEFERKIHLKPEKNMFIGFATSDYGVSEAGYENEMSIFTHHWIKAIQTPNIDIYEVMMITRRNVIYDTKEQQIPCEVSSLIEPFYFNKE